MQEEGIFNRLSKKESSRKQKTLTRLNHYLDGIKDMSVLPSALFVVDTKREQLAVNEANRLGIPIFGVVDTNGDPNEVQYPIPANDDAIRAIKLICEIISKAVADGREDILAKQQARLAPKVEAQAAAPVAPVAPLEAVIAEAVVNPEVLATVAGVIPEDDAAKKKAARKRKTEEEEEAALKASKAARVEG
jgi:small subunit ribosomal protein S2